ncbi:MAG: polyprenyl synthetase family protein [Anaerolineae bacterium]|nr:polyprenyl synthetase family protein [Anaerolineae bacterium]
MEIGIRAARLREIVLTLPALAAWPEAAAVFPARGDEPLRFDWQLPVLACRAVGGAEEVALPAAAAVACLQISIILADDMLDQDPRGEHRRLGVGRTANLALAFQAAAMALIGRAPAGADARSAAQAALADAALMTAYGQELDVQNLPGEANYWRVVKAKSTPFYGAAVQVGALLGGADAATAQGIYDLGVFLGEMIQIVDDLTDAFQTPANPDWTEGRNNLALLFATTAGHARRDELLALIPRAADPAALHTAQEILIGAGAVSYCVYQWLARYRAARALLARLSLADPRPLLHAVEVQVAPLHRWLDSIGIAGPTELEQIIA